MSTDEAVERGPNYDWKHEAKHYQDECESLRELLKKVERSGDKLFEENYALRAKLEIAMEVVHEFDSWGSLVAAEALDKISKLSTLKDTTKP